MWKKTLIASTALIFVGTTLVVAQQRSPGPGGTRDVIRWQPNAEDMAAFTDARVAALKAGLRLTTEQEKNWSAFESALRDFAKLRTDRLAAMHAMPRADVGGDDLIARLQQRADALSKRAAAFKQLADTAAPLYQSLDEAQKRRFIVLARMLRPRSHFANWRGHGDMGREGMGRGGFMRPHFSPRGLNGERFGDLGFEERGSAAPRAMGR